ncbi:protein of unknown function [Pedobacter westerhofensis]|uniref:Sialate O-acetylesterase domain-containing protein n=1 Tax=Pedobacter westerhofensis TaxID=425512 RepID=A0A521C538_9SPHI|nr:sialate O-acetylesterase [Pedobacter westerhofensis]SMO54566.1 protein of unknown function [Pedobacter westerhofensis]
MKQKGWFDHSLDVEKLQKDSTAYILTLGQSNAANSSNSLDTGSLNTYSYYNGQLYKAEDPLIGCDGVGGSVWPILADKMIAGNKYKRVVIIPIAVGSTTVKNWAEGECNILLNNTLNDLRKHKIVLTQILWQQGESDNGTSKILYKRYLSQVLNNIRSCRQSAPFYCAITSYSNLAESKPLGVDSTIQDAQREFIKENKNVLVGPNTDTIIDAIDRHDSLHFSKVGKHKCADLWYKALYPSWSL